MRSAVACCVLVLSAAPALAQKSARDAFWSASDLVAVSANPAAHVSTVSAAAKRRPASAPSGHVSPALVAQNGYGAQPHLVRVSSDEIGLRYSLLLRNAAGGYDEVAANTVFHAGQDLNLSVLPNQAGYLYVIEQGSSGAWSCIFPGAGSPVDANRVQGGKPVQIPGGKGAFRFDATPGKEKLFVVLSRNPVPDLDNTIRGLQTPGTASPAGPEPASTPNPQAPAMVLASNRIPDELVQRFASRDLSLVQVEDVGETSKAGDAGEKAVYVVSKGGPAASATSAAPRVVAPITLVHE